MAVGWQYHASAVAEELELNRLMDALAWPNMHSNAACVGKARLRSCMGQFAGAWLVSCPTSPALVFDDCDLLCAVRLRLGMAIRYEGGDLHGYTALAVSMGGGINARHSVVINAWRQVFIEAGGSVPDRRVEQLLSDTHVRVPPYDYAGWTRLCLV